MKIIRISVYQKYLPFHKPYWLSGGRLRFDSLDASFVKLETDADITGWGEGTPWGHTYVPAHGPGIRAGIATMAISILGLDPRQLMHIERAMDLCLPGHFYAKSPLDMACWDIAGQAAGLSIADLLGGRYDSGTAIASSVSNGTPQVMLDEIKRFRKLGYYYHSAKVGADAEKDIERIKYLEANRLQGESILYDVNRAWSRAQASTVMNALSGYRFAIEQPGETLDDIAAVRKLTTIPISIDESLVTLNDAVRIAHEGIAEIFGIKLNRVGGLSKARRIRDIALAHGIQVYVMATGGTVMADAEAAHLAQSIPEEFRLACWACQDMITIDIAPGQAPRNQNGVLTVSEAPGLGFAPDEHLLGDPVAVYE